MGQRGEASTGDTSNRHLPLQIGKPWANALAQNLDCHKPGHAFLGPHRRLLYLLLLYLFVLMCLFERKTEAERE